MLGTAGIGDTIVVADLEAGMGTVTRLGDRPVDVVLTVVEPTAKAIEVGRRLAGLVEEKHLGDVVVVANRTSSPADLAAIEAALPGRTIVAVPDDPAIVDADRDGVAPLDRHPDSPAVAALAGLARDLLARA